MRAGWMIIVTLGCGGSSAMPGVDASAVPDVGAPGDGTIEDAPAEVTPPSCVGLTATCGPTGTSSCCTSGMVPGGSFYRSYDVGTDNRHPAMNAPATVGAFRLDTYEITVGRFRKFVEAGGGTQLSAPAAGAGARTLGGVTNQGGWEESWNAELAVDTTAFVASLKCSSEFETWTDTPVANEERPMTCINWYEAMAFCLWDGGFLPTEAEWNFAAAGGEQQRAYPWSSPPSSLTVDATHTSYYLDSTSMCVGDMVAGCELADITRVGSRPAGDGRWGHADLGGNVAEWVLDWGGTYPTPCSDCAGLTASSIRTIRGGSFYSAVGELRGAFRGDGLPASHYRIAGARCARVP